MGSASHIDWNSGTYRSGAQHPSQKIVVAGDWAAIRRFDGVTGGVYGDLLPLLRECDLRIVNLESPLTDSGAPIWKDGPNLCAHPKAIGALQVVPFQVACLANNHVMDLGVDGLSSTLKTLADARIASVGAGMNPGEAYQPLSIQCGNLKVGIVNFCEGEDCTAAIDRADDGAGVFGWDVERAANSVIELRETNDVVLAIVHCGREYAPVPPPYVVASFRRLAAAGATAVIGHHPHVPQGVEIHNGCPIFYSLGNFVFDQPVDSYFRKTGYLVILEIAKSGINQFRMVPYHIESEQLRLLTGDEAVAFLNDLRRVSEVFERNVDVEEVWNAFLDSVGIEGLERTENRRTHQLEPIERQYAALRNRFVTPAHRELWIGITNRIVAGNIGSSPEWARSLVDEWKSRPDILK